MKRDAFSVVAEMLDLTTKLLKISVDELTNEVGYKRTGNLDQLEVNYRWSSIVVDQSTDPDKMGDKLIQHTT